MSSLVYFVPVVDVSWLNFGPLNPEKNYIAEPPPLELCLEESEKVIDLMKELYHGKFAFAVITGTYCRDAFSQEPFLKTWRRAIEQGGEILVHTHEEIAGVGTKNSDQKHMEEVIRRQYNNLLSGGITPVGFRGGLYGYANFLTPLLEELNVNIEFSAAPDINKPDREAVWEGIPYSAFYLCPEDKTHYSCNHKLSNVLEVPIGADGKGSSNTNYLYIDNSYTNIKTLTGIWDIILERANINEVPQIIHTLFHTFSMSNQEMIDRLRHFTDYIYKNNGQVITPTEARETYDYYHD